MKNMEFRKLTAQEQEEYQAKTDEIVDAILALNPEERNDSNSEFFRLQAQLDQLHKDMNLIYTGRGLVKQL